MSIITIVGAGQMGSAMCFPARSNGHEVRLVGTPLDREIIERAKVDRWHLNLKRYLPEGVKYYQIEDMRAALMGAAKGDTVVAKTRNGAKTLKVVNIE